MNTVAFIMVAFIFVWCVVDIVKSIKDEVDKHNKK